MRLFSKKAQAAPVAKPLPQKVRRVATLTPEEYRSNPALVKAAGAKLNDPEVLTMLDVVWNAHPAFDVPIVTADLASRAVDQARGEGYTRALRVLQSLGEFTPPNKPIEATFEPDNDKGE